LAINTDVKKKKFYLVIIYKTFMCQ